MGCPVSKRVQTSSDVSSNHSQNIPDENSNGLLCQPQRRQVGETHNLNQQIQNIPGQINNHNGSIPKARQRFDNHTSSIFKPESTRTQSQVEFFAMLDSKIEADEIHHDLKVFYSAENNSKMELSSCGFYEEVSAISYGNTSGTSQAGPLPSIGSLLEGFRDHNENHRQLCSSKQTTWQHFRICNEKNIRKCSMSTLCPFYRDDPIFTLDSMGQSSQKELGVVEGALKYPIEDPRSNKNIPSDEQTENYQFKSHIKYSPKQCFTFPLRMTQRSDVDGPKVENYSIDYPAASGSFFQMDNFLKVTHLTQDSAGESSDRNDLPNSEYSGTPHAVSLSRKTKSENLKSPVDSKSREESIRELLDSLGELFSGGAGFQRLSRDNILDSSVQCIQSLLRTRKGVKQELNRNKTDRVSKKEINKPKRQKRQQEAKGSGETTTTKIKRRCLKTVQKRQDEAKQASNIKNKNKRKPKYVKPTTVSEDVTRVVSSSKKTVRHVKDKSQDLAKQGSRRKKNMKRKPKVKPTRVSEDATGVSEDKTRVSEDKTRVSEVGARAVILSSKSRKTNRKTFGITFVNETNSSSRVSDTATKSVALFFADKPVNAVKGSKKRKEIAQREQKGEKSKLKNAKLSKKEMERLERRGFLMYAKIWRPRLKKEMSVCSRVQITDLLKCRWQGLSRNTKRRYQKKTEVQESTRVKSNKNGGQEGSTQSKKKQTSNSEKLHGLRQQRKKEQEKIKRRELENNVQGRPSKKAKKEKTAINNDKVNTVDNVLNWVQCGKCKNWRTLPEHVDVTTLPKRWFCRLNKDKKHNKCSISQESYCIKSKIV